MDLGISGRVALVTGGARSLGQADATVLAAEGCRVAIFDLNAEGAEETAKTIEASGGTARGYACDVRAAAQVGAAVAAVERDLGPVDICVNNAGIIFTMAQLKDMNDADWELNLAVNLTGSYNVTKAVFPGMRSPPDSSPGRWCRRSPSPTSARASAASPRASRQDRRLSKAGSIAFSSAVISPSRL